MAGVKGRSGGPRPGAGRPKKVRAPIAVPAAPTPLEFLLSVMNDPAADADLRLKAAVSAAQYVHTRKQDGGKKDEAQDKAKRVSQGKYAAAAMPLTLVKRGT